jgi:hypothetical protein
MQNDRELSYSAEQKRRETEVEEIPPIIPERRGQKH